jgi:hypothetical protein
MTNSGWRKRQIVDESHSSKGTSMNKQCKFKVGKYNCGSYAFNLDEEDINQGDYCDRHYWQDQAQKARADEREAMLHLSVLHRAPWHFQESIRARSQAPCNHEWIDATQTKPQWHCAKCGKEYTKEKA